MDHNYYENHSTFLDAKLSMREKMVSAVVKRYHRTRPLVTDAECGNRPRWSPPSDEMAVQVSAIKTVAVITVIIQEDLHRVTAAARKRKKSIESTAALTITRTTIMTMRLLDKKSVPTERLLTVLTGKVLTPLPINMELGPTLMAAVHLT